MDFDKSKENIQPLRGGRNVSQLETALQAQSSTEAQMQLQLQKEEHEALLLNYQGPDPLDPWFNYIQWIEQSFPKHGHEGHIDKLIKDCLQKFEKDKRYYQDRRFIKLWIRYIDCLANPLELYQRLYNSGIGVECSEFYRAWACYCEESNDFKKADQVYVLGIEAQAQPFDELEQAHNNFRIFFAQRMLYDDSPTKRKAATALAETRMALTSLRTFKRRNIASVSSQRTGDSIRSIVPGVVRTQNSQAHGNDQPGTSNIMVTVYQDEPSTSHIPVPAQNVPIAASLLEAGVNAENEKEVGIWSNNRTKMVATQVVPHQQMAMPFTPYEDEELILSPHHMSYCLDDLSTFSVPLSVPDPPEQNKIPCYNKAAVYKNDTEYSLEEIRSRRYLDQYQMNTVTTINALTQQTETQQAGSANAREPASALQTLVACALHEQDQLDQLMPLNLPALQNITKEQHIHSPGEPHMLVNMDSKEFSQMANPNSEITLSSNQKNEKDRYTLEYLQNGDAKSEPMEYNNVNTDYESKNNLVPLEEFNRSLMENFNENSVTAHTKAARWELRNIFNDASSTEQPSMVQPIVQQFDMSKFDIHEDKSMTMALNTKKLATPPVKMDDTTPMDKENGPRGFNAPANPVSATTSNNVNNSIMLEESACTQLFNFNIPVASTPNAAKFKKPSSNAEPGKGAVRKFSMEGSGGGEHNSEHMPSQTEQTPNNDYQQNGLSVIMESTREFNSKSGSSSSGQSTRNTTSGYTMRDSQHYASQVNYDYTYAQDPAGYNKRNSAATQPRLSNGQFTRSYPKDGAQPDPNPSPQYPTHDHQYQKPNTYNAFGHRNMQHAYGHTQSYAQSGTAYQQPQTYTQNQQSYTPPHPQGYPSPQHSGQSPHHQVQSPGHVPPAFQSPHQGYNHAGYQTTVPSSPQHVYANTARVDYTNNQGFASPSPVPQAYASPQQNQAAYQNPAHRSSNYSNGNQYYQRNVSSAYPNTQQQHASYQQQHLYQQQQQPNQYAQNNYMNTNHHNQNYNAQNASYQGHAKVVTDQHNYSQIQSKPTPEPQTYNQMHAKNASENQNYNYQNTTSSQMAFQVYQSPVQNNSQYSNNTMAVQNQAPNITQSRAQTSPMQSSPMQTSPSESHSKQTYTQHNNTSAPYQPQDIPNSSKQGTQSDLQEKTLKNIDTTLQTPTPTQSPTPYKSPTSILRSVRHEQPHGKPQNANTTDAGFSNQFLNFISTRNEPKDNANTPKFSNSPNISQKMHKNLYVSSPEQAQLPPSTGPTPMEPKGALQSQTPMQSAKVNSHMSSEKQKDVSKRQLDFEMRQELQSEDSRDSMGGKEGKISSVHSRKSIASVHTGGWGMEVDSESSMDCHTFKTTSSNSMLETNDIPRPAIIDFPDIIDPFNNDLCNDLLQYVQFPNKTHCEGYVEVKSVPKLQQSTLASFGNYRFSVEKQLGKGTYGSVFSSLDLTSNKPVALKYQKPGHPWEFYICKEIKSRIKDPFMLPGYMDISAAFLGDNASIFVSELSKYGSLLDVANKVKASTTKCINEHIVMLLTAEMLSIVHYLHKAEIIHADIKPDNFLLMKIPTAEWRTPSLQLIDMGCSIDMSLFPEDTTFKKVITTEGFTCLEMRERRPWTYQTDLYCLAGTVHVILMGSYMKTAYRVGQWNIDKKLPRYMKVNLWDKVFTTLLNIPDCTSLPDLMDLKQEIDITLRNDEQLTSHLRTFANVLKCR